MRERPIRNLDELMDGAVAERFNDALMRIWENVFDPETCATKKRSVVLTVSIEPNEKRDACNLSVRVVPKLAPHVDLSQTVMLSIDGDGCVTATERTAQAPGQLDLMGNETIQKTIEFRR